jgi:anti-sigma factor RsiW
MMSSEQALAREITCREFVGLIHALREDELGDHDRRSFLQHSRKCPKCAHYLTGFERTISAVKRMAEDSSGPDVTTMPDSLVGKILSDLWKLLDRSSS